MHKCQEPGSLYQEINKVFWGFIFGSTCIKFKEWFNASTKTMPEHLFLIYIFCTMLKYLVLVLNIIKIILVKILSYKIKIKTFSIEWYINFGIH